MGKSIYKLYWRGDLKLLQQPMIAVIGSRDVSLDGIKRTQQIVKELVKLGYCIVSGLAKGVDATAHRTALECEGNTIAVLGTDITTCYPAVNGSLKTAIEMCGLVLSQFPVGFVIDKSRFHQRNILMAHLSQASIVTEATITSGTRSQVACCVRLKKKVGFLASVVAQGHPWVTDAIQSGYGVIISSKQDLKTLV